VFLANDDFAKQSEVNPATVDPKKSSDFPQVNGNANGFVPINNKPKR
jgi:hypothetical protein